MKNRLATLALSAALLAAPSAAFAQKDVGEFSKDDAESVLSDENCPVKLPNGQCARESDERGFSFQAINKDKPKQDSVNIQRTTTPRNAATGKATSQRGTQVKSLTPQPTATPRPRELPLQFGLGSFELSTQSKANLANLATALKTPENMAKKIRITGHTDKSGSVTLNQELSQKRANAAAEYIASLGVDRTRIEAVGMGFGDMLPGMSAYSPRNRRVEVERIE